MKLSLLLSVCGLFFIQAPRAFASALLKPTSGVTQALSAKSLTIDTQLRGAFAKTTLTTVYANPNDEQIEADFLYSAPKGSVVTGFAYWYGDEKVVARVVEKGRAAKIYQYITSRMRDPALIEMVGKNAFRARIFPVEANQDLKIEIQLAQTLPQTKAGPLWTYPLREETRDHALKDVKIHLQSSGSVSSNMGAFKNGVLNLEKHNFKASDDLRALIQQKPAPIRASLIAARDGGSDGFFALSLTPNNAVARPALKIAGVATYEVLMPKLTRLGAGQPFVVVGRYRGNGKAVVALNGQSFEIEFPDAVEKNNLASQLWAANRIEALSENPNNRVQVMALSKRFGVPSKWTSWLAIPEEERQNFKRQMWATDRADAAKAYAQAIARADTKAAKEQKVIFDALTQNLVKDGHNYAEEEELQPLDRYLNDELRHLLRAQVRAKYEGKVSKAQLAQWTTWAKNLRKAGADDEGEGVDLPVYVIEDEMRIASRLYMQEVEFGRSKGVKARQYKARLKELAKTKTAQEYEWDEDAFLDEQAEVRANALAMDIAANRISDKPDHKRETQLKARLKRLEAATDIDTNEMLENAVNSVAGVKFESLAQQWAGEIKAGRAEGANAQKYGRQVQALQKRLGVTDLEVVDEAWKSLAQETGRQFAPAIQTQGLNGEAAKRMQAQLAKIASIGKRDKDDFARKGWSEVASNLISQLRSEIHAERAGSAKSVQLQAQLKMLEKRTGEEYSEVPRYAWKDVQNEVASAFAKEIQAKQENTPNGQRLSAKLERALKGAGERYDWTVKAAWETRARSVVSKRIEEVLQHGPDTPLAKSLKSESDQLLSKAKSDSGEFEKYAAADTLRKLNLQLGDEIVKKTENSPKSVKLAKQRADLLQSMPTLNESVLGPYESLDFAWEARAHESAYKLLEAQKKGDEEKVPTLQEELDLAVKKGQKSSEEVLAWEKVRVDNNSPLLTATDYRLRPGDPLISVLAPATCRQVVAVMPDGTLLPLRYERQKGAWEAHFDVPMGAAQGDYRVQVLIVAADGKRKRLTMNFAVDLKAPTGAASLQSKGDVWHLRLETDEQTDRVSAFLPWNERVELRRNGEGVFTSDVTVPVESSDPAKVRFVLTDKAHNRTELIVDWK